MTRRAALLVTAALVLTGCGGGDADRNPKVVTETVFLDRLSRAIAAVNTTRAQLATDGTAIGTAAARLDDVDAVAVTGDRAKVRAARTPAARAFTPAAAAARRLTKDVTAYDRAIAALAAANKEDGLDVIQHRALDAVVTAGRAELTALHAYATVVATVWPRYETLDENQRLWLMRASNGWYRNQQEAANNYIVLTDRAAIDAARRSLAAADTRRIAAARRAGDALRTARGALAALIG